MIDKTAGLPTQIRQLERRLKEMDASKIKPALVKEITDTIQNLKTLLKEKMDKKEQRKKDKAQAAVPQEVEKEAISVPNAADVGAVAPNNVVPQAPGAPEATPTTPDDQKVSCPLCGGITFPDQASYQQHMEFTHASDIMPTAPGQKLDKTVAAVEDNVVMPKQDFIDEHEKLVKELEPLVEEHKDQGAELKEVKKEAGPQFKLDDEVKPSRGSESTGKVMRWDGKPSDLVYVAWDSGPLAERDTFGGYYPNDLQLVQEEQPVEAAMPEAKPVCQSCESTKQKHGDLRTNYEGFLKDLKEERDIHYTQGNQSWVTRLDQKIRDLEKSMEEKFGNEKQAASDCVMCGKNKGETQFDTCSDDCQIALRNRELDKSQPPTPQREPNWHQRQRPPVDRERWGTKEATGGPELIRQINKATSGHGYDSTVYDLTNGRFQRNVPLKITDTNVRMRQPENGTFELKYSGMPEWRPVLEPEFQQWLAEWKTINQANNQKEGGAQNAEDLTIMDHTPPRANSGPDAGGKDSHDEFQDEWAMPAGIELQSKLPKNQQRELDQLVQQSVYGYQINMMDMTKVYQAGEAAYVSGGVVMSAVKAYLDSLVAAGKATKTASLNAPVTEPTKIAVFNKEFVATPVNGQKAFAGYDISQDGKKLFNIKAKASQPMTQKQLEFCTEVELTRGFKQAKLTEKVAFLEAGSTVYITATDSTRKRVRFASLEQGLRGWLPVSKIKLIALEAQPVTHNGHSDKVLGASGSETLIDCTESGPIWVNSAELLDANRPPATPESLNDLESKVVCPKCKGEGRPGFGSCPECGGYATEMKERKESSKECPKCHKPLIPGDHEKCRYCWDKESAQGKGYILPEDEDQGIATGYPANYFRYALAKDRADNNGLIDVEDGDLTPVGLAAKKQEMTEGHDIEAGRLCQRCHGDVNEATAPGGICKACRAEMKAEEAEKNEREASRPTWRTCKTCSKEFCTSQYKDYCSEDCYAKAGSPAEAPAESWPIYQEDRPRGRYAAQECKYCDHRPSSHTDGKGNSSGCSICDCSGYEKSSEKQSAKECADCHGTFEGAEGEKCPTCGRFAVQKTAELGYFTCDDCGNKSDSANMVSRWGLDMCEECADKRRASASFKKRALAPALPPQILNRRNEVNADNGECNLCHQQKPIKPMIAGGVGGANLCDNCIAILEKEQAEVDNEKFASSNQIMIHCKDCNKTFYTAPDSGIDKCPDCNKSASASLNKSATVTHQKDGWHVLSEKGKNLGGPYKSKAEAVKRLRQVEYFKHNGSLKPFSKKALTKIAGRPDPDEPEETGESDLMDSFVQLSNGQFALVQSHDEGGMIEVDLLGKTETGYKYVTESPIPVPASAVKRILEWDEIQALKIEHEPWPTEAAPGVKQADQVTDETITTNDPNAVLPDPNNILLTAPTTIQNVQPTDDDNLEVPVAPPTSPPSPGQKWVFDTQFNKYVSMPDPTAAKTI